MFTNYQQVSDKAKERLSNICEIYLDKSKGVYFYKFDLYRNGKFPYQMTFLDKISICDSFSEKCLYKIDMSRWEIIYEDVPKREVLHKGIDDTRQKCLRLSCIDTYCKFPKLENLCEAYPYVTPYEIKIIRNTVNVRIVFIYI